MIMVTGILLYHFFSLFIGETEPTQAPAFFSTGPDQGTLLKTDYTNVPSHVHVAFVVFQLPSAIQFLFLLPSPPASARHSIPSLAQQKKVRNDVK